MSKSYGGKKITDEMIQKGLICGVICMKENNITKYVCPIKITNSRSLSFTFPQSDVTHFLLAGKMIPISPRTDFTEDISFYLASAVMRSVRDGLDINEVSTIEVGNQDYSATYKVIRASKDVFLCSIVMKSQGIDSEEEDPQ